MATTEGSVNSFGAKDQDRRRKRAYKLYKHYAKPTRASMCSTLDYVKDTDVTRQDLDLLPWNPEGTEVIKEAMKSLKKKKDKKEKERNGREDTAFVESNDYNKLPTLLKGQMRDSSTILDLSWNAISGSLDTSSCIWDQHHTQAHRESTEQLQTIKVEEEHKRRREERRRKREEATKKSMPEVTEQEKHRAEEIRREDTRRKMIQARRDDRLECTFLWYTRMATPTRTEFERQIATQKVDITPEDVDLLPWNESETRVMNLAAVNAMLIRTRMLKQSGTQLPAPR
jgi:hypothetical protein